MSPIQVIYPSLLKGAVFAGDLITLRKLLKQKQLPLTTPDPENGWPMMFYAIQSHKNDIVSYFLEAGFDKNSIYKDFEHNTALMVAIESKNHEAFSMYVEKFSHTIFMINKQGKSPLLLATEKGVNDMIKVLLDMGADVNSTDSDGSTPLHHASSYGHFETVSILLENGADVSVLNKKGWSPLDYAYSVDMKDYIESCVTSLNAPSSTKGVLGYSVLPSPPKTSMGPLSTSPPVTKENVSVPILRSLF